MGGEEESCVLEKTSHGESLYCCWKIGETNLLVDNNVFGDFVPFLFSPFLCWGHVLPQEQFHSSNDHAGNQSVCVPVTQQHGCKQL